MIPSARSYIGLIAGVVVWLAIEALEYLRIDDPIGAVPVHLFAGIWGTLSIGLFAAGKYGLPTASGADTTTVVTGLLYGGGVSQLGTQLVGSVATVILSFVAAFVIMYAIKMAGQLRLSAAKEIEGLDIAEHGASAYPEYVLNGNDGTPKSLDDIKGVGVPVRAPGAAGD